MHESLVSLKPQWSQFALAERWWTIPEMSAAVWIEAVLTDAGLDIVPGLVEDGDKLDELLDNGEVTFDELRDAGREALAYHGGRSWVTTTRLISYYAMPLGRGELMLRGVNLRKISLAAYCDAMYALIMRNLVKKEDRAKFEAELTRPIPGAGVDRKAAMAEFEKIAPPKPTAPPSDD